MGTSRDSCPWRENRRSLEGDSFSVIAKLGIKLGKLRTEWHSYPISIHRLETCNDTQGRIFNR